MEVPSLLDELTWMNPEAGGGPWLGHAHHRWLCTLQVDELVFLSKFHSLHSPRRARVPRGWAEQLTVQERMLAHFWEGSLPARERMEIIAFPFEEIERAVAERFRPSAPRRLALSASERAQRQALRAGRALRRKASAILTSSR